MSTAARDEIPGTANTAAAEAQVTSTDKDKTSVDNTANSPSTPPSPTTKLLKDSGYRVVKKIGSGSYSKVKLAYSEKDKTMVAIKVVSKYHVPEEFLRKFLYNEIKVAKHLKHENVIQYYQSIESSQRLYVIMQYCENGSILDLIHHERRLSEARAAHYFRQILAAVEYCHNQGICHRDIKCENILLDRHDVVKLIDFGFAKFYRTPVVEKKAAKKSPHSSLTTARQRVGTSLGLLRKKDKESMLSETYCGSYAYASPEILKGIPYHPMMSDVWACGCVLFAMVYGRLPFDDREPAKLIKQVQNPVAFPSQIHTSEEFKNCIRKIFAPLKTRCSLEKLSEDFWVKNGHQLVVPESASTSRRMSTR